MRKADSPQYTAIQQDGKLGAAPTRGHSLRCKYEMLRVHCNTGALHQAILVAGSNGMGAEKHLKKSEISPSFPHQRCVEQGRNGMGNLPRVNVQLTVSILTEQLIRQFLRNSILAINILLGKLYEKDNSHQLSFDLPHCCCGLLTVVIAACKLNCNYYYERSRYDIRKCAKATS